MNEHERKIKRVVSQIKNIMAGVPAQLDHQENLETGKTRIVEGHLVLKTDWHHMEWLLDSLLS